MPPPHIPVGEGSQGFLLGRYSPLHVPQSETCTDCSLGPCDLSTERGACGSDMRTKCARDSLLAACRGASQMISHARELLDEALKRFGRDEKISHGRNVRYPSICTMLFTGKPIYTLDDADDALKYAERQLSELLAAATAPGELDVLDLECKAMHAGSMFYLRRRWRSSSRNPASGFVARLNRTS